MIPIKKPTEKGMNTMLKQIRLLMPYGESFLFVDEFEEITEDGARGHYTYREDEYFYDGHFPGNPITPGAIMIETMAQIGLVGLGIFLTGVDTEEAKSDFVFTSSDVSFLNKVLPGEKVIVQSEKIYFRFGKLKCNVTMRNEAGKDICRGVLSGMVLPKSMTR